jgi:hypothetical protein
MAIIDPVQVFVEATVTIVNGDAELRTLFVRPTGTLIVPWATMKLNTPVPMIAYQQVTSVPLAVHTDRLDLQLSVFATRGADANKAVFRLEQLLRTPAYAALSLDIARDPDNPWLRQWPDADPSPDNAAAVRADLGLSFLISG